MVLGVVISANENEAKLSNFSIRFVPKRSDTDQLDITFKLTGFLTPLIITLKSVPFE